MTVSGFNKDVSKLSRASITAPLPARIMPTEVMQLSVQGALCLAAL